MTDEISPELARIDAMLAIEDVADLLRMPVASLRYWWVQGAGARGFIIGATATLRPGPTCSQGS